MTLTPEQVSDLRCVGGVTVEVPPRKRPRAARSGFAAEIRRECERVGMLVATATPRGRSEVMEVQLVGEITDGRRVAFDDDTVCYDEVEPRMRLSIDAVRRTATRVQGR